MARDRPKQLVVQVRTFYFQGELRKRVSTRGALLKSGYLSVVGLSRA